MIIGVKIFKDENELTITKDMQTNELSFKIQDNASLITDENMEVDEEKVTKIIQYFYDIVDTIK